MKYDDRPGRFWRDATAFRSVVTRPIFWRLLVFVGFAWLVCGIGWVGHHRPDLEIGIAPYEVAGAALGLLLVLRTNAGYERWWEGRRLWGGIVNQSRHLGVVVLSHGPDDPDWRDRGVRLVAAFDQVARRSLRDQREMPEVADLLRGGRGGAGRRGSPHARVHGAPARGSFPRGVRSPRDGLLPVPGRPTVTWRRSWTTSGAASGLSRPRCPGPTPS